MDASGLDPRALLDGIELEVAPGRCLALVGPSGSGKSTLARLIARFYDVEGGAVRVSGVDVREATFPWLLSRVAVVLQDVALSHDTVHDNIAFGLKIRKWSREDIDKRVGELIGLDVGALHPELGVAAADGGVVEDEVTVGVASLMIHVPF